MQRSTFPHIATERHPHATGKRVAMSLRSGLVKPDKKDIEIAQEVLKVHAKLKLTSIATGEWRWINSNKRSNYLKLLEEGNAINLANCLANMFRNDSVYGIISSDFSRINTKKGRLDLENQILLDLDTLDEFDDTDHKKVEWSLSARRCGNPYGYVTRKNTLITVDTARHMYYVNKILTLLKDSSLRNPTLVEIGGGYGGFCLELFSRARPAGFTYVNCDLPETLYLCYYFLRKSLPSLSIGWALEKMPISDIVLVPAQNKGLIRRADFIFNALSLSEMGRQTVKEYMTLLHRIKPEYFLHTNSNFVLFPNSERHVEVTATEFGVKDSLYKRVYMALSPWQGGGGGRSREYLYVKRKK